MRFAATWGKMPLAEKMQFSVPSRQRTNESQKFFCELFDEQTTRYVLISQYQANAIGRSRFGVGLQKQLGFTPRQKNS